MPSDALAKRKLGCFRLTSEFLRLAKRKTLRGLFSKMIVLEAVYNKDANYIEYVAESYLFKPLNYGDIVPTYDLKFNKNGTIIGASSEFMPVTTLIIFPKPEELVTPLGFIRFTK